MCQYLGTFLPERVLDAREDESRDAGEVAGLHAESRQNCLNRFKQLFWKPCSFEGIQAGRPGAGSGGAGKSNSVPINSDDIRDDAGVRLSSA